MFYEIDSLTNFAIFKGKHLYWSFFLILKRDANADVSCEYSEMFSFLQFFLYRTPVHYTFWKFYVIIELLGRLWVQN